MRSLRLRVDAAEEIAQAFELVRERVLQLVFVGAYELVFDHFEVTSQVRAEERGFLGRELEVHARHERRDRAKQVRALLKREAWATTS